MHRWLSILVSLTLSLPVVSQQSNYPKAVNAFKNQQYDSALLFIQQAIDYFQQNNHRDSQVFSLVYKADIIWTTSGTPPALAILKATESIADKLSSNSIAKVALLDKKAQIHLHNAEPETARKYFLKALHAIPPNATPNNAYGSFYANISWYYLEMGDFVPAMNYAVKSREVFEKLHGKDAAQLRSVYQSMMYIAHDAGNYQEAEKYGLELQRLSEMSLHSSHPKRGLMHNDLGTLYETMHRMDEALYHRQKMVSIIQQDYNKHKNPQLLAIAYNNMGKLYLTTGELQLAEAYAEKAKALHEINFGKKGAGIVRPLVHLADIKMELGNFDAASNLFREAYALQQEIDKENWKEMAYIEAQYGDLYFEQKNYTTAEAYYKKAIQHYKQAGIKDILTLEMTFSTLGETCIRIGKHSEGMALLKDGLMKYKKRYPKGNIVIAGQYNRISENYLFLGQPETALQYSDSVFQELLQTHNLPKDTDWVKELPYNQHIIRYIQNRTQIEAILYDKSGNTEALNNVLLLATQYSRYLQKALPALRTQSSLMQLADKHRSIFNTAIDAAWEMYQTSNNKQYLEKAFEFSERSRGLLLRLSSNNMIIDAELLKKGDAEEDLQQRKQISTLNAQYLDSDTKSDSLLTLLTVAIEKYRLYQDSLIQSGNESAKLRYNLEPSTIADIQTRLQQTGQTLLQYAADSNHVYVFVITAKSFTVHKQAVNLSKSIAALKQLYNLPIQEFNKHASYLYQQLMLPIRQHIGSEKLIIVPDGELFYLNFELLVTNNQNNSFAKNHYLIKDYEISYQLSATNWATPLARLTAKSKAILLTPVFTDEMKNAYRKFKGDSSSIDYEYLHLLRQPFAASAARQISRYIDNDLMTEQDADEEAFKRAAGKYNILHLGTHAEVNNAAPLHSRFFLAKQLLPDSVANEDGYLHAYEIYGMRLTSELSVLTACETGTGQLNKGEGIISLAHSFMYAGCPSVVMSLWKIDEKSSADIIARFYKKLAKGSAKSESLRLAKLEHMQASEQNAHPYFWAGMTLMGNEEPIYAATSSTRLWLIAIVVVLFFGMWRFRVAKKASTR